MKKIKYGLRKSVGGCCLPHSALGKVLLLDQARELETTGRSAFGRLFHDLGQVGLLE